MPITLFEQLGQIAASATYDSTVPLANARSQSHLEGDLNVLRSLIAGITGETDFDVAPDKTIAQLAAQAAPDDVVFLHFVQPMDESVPGTQSAVSATENQTKLDLSLDITGEVVDSEGAGVAGAWAAQLTSQANFTSAHNQVEIRNFTTKQPMVDAQGRPVQGFLQLDGTAPALPHTLTGSGVFLVVALKVWDGTAYVNYTLTSADSFAQWEVALPRFTSLATMPKRGFGPMFVDLAEQADLGNVLGASGDHIGPANTNVANRFSAVNTAITARVTASQTNATDIDDLEAFTGSAGAAAPTYASAIYITQGEDIQHTVGELDAALSTEAGDRASGDSTNAAAISNHIANATGAHAATAISATDVTGGAATDVQGVLANLNQKIDDVSPAFSDLTVPSGITAGQPLTVPSYTVGTTAGTNARFVYNGMWLTPGDDYTEAGTAETASTTITMLRSLTQNKKVMAMVLK